MGTIIKSIVVGIVQGLTEFLPVSSVGHILIAQEILGLDFGEGNILFMIALHLATAMSVAVVFRKDIVSILKGLLLFRWNDETRFSLMVLITMVPAVFVGLFLGDLVERLFTSLLTIGLMLLVSGWLLYFAGLAAPAQRPITSRDAFTVGLAQGFAALLPGLSRTGATICTSIFLGHGKMEATRFSFLMLLPLLLGASAKLLISLPGVSLLPGNISWIPLVSGFASAFVTGIFACKWMICLVKTAKLHYFSLYCLFAGFLVLTYVYTN